MRCNFADLLMVVKLIPYKKQISRFGYDPGIKESDEVELLSRGRTVYISRD